MTKIELTKTAINIVVGTGAGKIVGSIIKNNTNPQTVTDQVTMLTGSFVLGAMVADASKDYTNAKIDEITNWWAENVTKN